MRSLSMLIAACFAVAAVAVGACGGGATQPAAPPGHHDDDHHARPAGSGAAADADLKPPGEAKIGDRTRCPVSGEKFTVTEKSPHLEHDGKTYYFCCPPCSGRFKENPAKFLSKPSSS